MDWRRFANAFEQQTKATKKNSSFVSFPSVQKKSDPAKILKSVECAEENQPLSGLFASLKNKSCNNPPQTGKYPV
jgi:hypothetical protein